LLEDSVTWGGIELAHAPVAPALSSATLSNASAGGSFLILVSLLSGDPELRTASLGIRSCPKHCNHGSPYTHPSGVWSLSWVTCSRSCKLPRPWVARFINHCKRYFFQVILEITAGDSRFFGSSIDTLGTVFAEYPQANCHTWRRKDHLLQTFEGSLRHPSPDTLE